MVDIATLAIAVDSRPLVQGTQALNRIGGQAQVTGTQVARAAQGMSTGMASTGRSAGMMRGQIQNASFQLQDMVVQLQMGTRASVVMSQQLPQLAGAFGAAGAAAGVFISLGAIAFAPLIDNLFRSSDAASENEEALDRLVDAIGRYNQMADIAMSTTGELQEQYGELAEEIRNAARAAAEASIQLAVRELRGAAASLGEGIDSAIDIAQRAAVAEGVVNDLLRRSMRGEALEATLDTARDMLELLREGAVAASAELGMLPEQAERLGLALLQVESARGIEEIAAAALRASQEIEMIRVTSGSIPDELAVVQQHLFDIASEAATAADNAEKLADESGNAARALDMVGAANLSGTVAQIVQLSRQLGVATSEAIALARAMPGYETSGASGPDAARFQVMNDRQSSIVFQRTYNSGARRGGGGGGSARAAQEQTAAMRVAQQAISQAERAAVTFAEVQAELNRLMSAGEIDADAYAAALDRAREILESTGSATDFMAQQVADLENGILDSIVAGDNLADTFQNITRAIARAALEAALFGRGPMAGGGGGGGGGILSGLFARIFSFDGGGYTGAGSRSGGLDGKGGFLAMMHPDETVVDHRRGTPNSGGLVVNQTTNNYASDDVEARTETRQKPDGTYDLIVNIVRRAEAEGRFDRARAARTGVTPRVNRR